MAEERYLLTEDEMYEQEESESGWAAIPRDLKAGLLFCAAAMAAAVLIVLVGVL